jgi:hypothetical protein
MVTTRQGTPEKAPPPAGIPTRCRCDLSHRGQQSQREERCQHHQQVNNIAASGARKEPPEPTLLPLLTQPPPPSAETQGTSESAVAAAVNFATTLDFGDPEDKEPEDLYDVQEEVEEEQPEDHDAMEDAFQRVIRKRKCEMNYDELYMYFETQLRGLGECPNLGCNCLAIFVDADARNSVNKYLCWFNAKTKYEQDSIVFEWYKYLWYLFKRSADKKTPFRMLYIDDGTAVVPQAVRMHLLCTKGIAAVLDWGKKRICSIRAASMKTSVMPMHKKVGKHAPHAIKQDQCKYEPLKDQKLKINLSRNNPFFRTVRPEGKKIPAKTLRSPFNFTSLILSQ